tara:strand:+ start:1888 stop:2403 length:516 start_codon:yes stop_codon:yes gene_type:complete
MNERPVKTWTNRTNQTNNTNWWDRSKTDLIYKIDEPYVRNIVLNYSGDSVVDKCEWVLNTPRWKPEFVCELCGAGNSKRGHRPACFFPTEVGYIYKCLKCEESLTFFQFLQKRNPNVARDYQFDRWIKKLTGSCYNCPEPPKNIKREYYAKKERELKERNKRTYEERLNRQ